jgi:hypothetical protein
MATQRHCDFLELSRIIQLMFHPLSGELSDYKDQEIENRLIELNKKYYAAARMGSKDLLTQLSTFVTIYRDELAKRHAQKLKQADGDLGQLINVD